MIKKNIILITLLLLLVASVAGVIEEKQSSTSESSISAYFEQIRDNPEELRAFFLAMPKGGDIHNHLTGAVYAEGLIDRAALEGKRVYLNNYSCPNNQSDIITPVNEFVNVSQAYNNSNLYNGLVDCWSMKDVECSNASGHDHFFATFGCFGGATNNTSSLVAELRNRAAIENVEYLELMTSAGEGETVKNLTKNLSWNDNLSSDKNLNSLYEDFDSRDLRNISKNISNYLNKTDKESIQIADASFKARNESGSGSNVTVKYLFSATRVMPKENVFAQLAIAFEVADISPLVVGINLLAAEDNRVALKDYSEQMEMIRFLHEKYPDVKIALHAGELKLGLVTPEDLRFHIHEAVTIGNASRIGHGVDIMSETDSAETLKQMAEKGICIEIMPVSNEEILGVHGEDHPFPVYLSHGVPVVLASDDAGVLRTDLAEQFVIIAHTYPQVKYSDFKKFVRNSLEYSFLDGEGIWLVKGAYTAFRPELKGCDFITGDLTQVGKNFLSGNEKAREEWKLEGEIAAFEQKAVKT